MKKLKMLQKKHIFQQKPSRNISKSISDMDLIFGGDRKTSRGLTLKRLSNPQPTKWSVPSTFSQRLPNLPFLELFLPTAWARPKISQHNHVDQNFGECNSYFKVAESQLLPSYDT